VTQSQIIQILLHDVIKGFWATLLKALGGRNQRLWSLHLGLKIDC